jgi:hypothetical protein
MKTTARFGMVFAFATLAFAQEPAIANLSIRAQIGTGDNLGIVGLNVGPTGSCTLLIRAIGPTLAGLGVAGPLTNPIIALYSGETKIAENDDWNATIAPATPATAPAFNAAGAFALAAGSQDSALLVTLNAGSYTVRIAGVGAGTGVCLVEIYLVGTTGARLMNMSMRGALGADQEGMIAGVVLSPGAGSRPLLVRAAGPALAALGVAGANLDPFMDLTRQPVGSQVVAGNGDWDTPVDDFGFNNGASEVSAARVGAFPFKAGSADAAFIGFFIPGTYTVRVRASSRNPPGLVLFEIYDITPFSVF